MLPIFSRRCFGSKISTFSPNPSSHQCTFWKYQEIRQLALHRILAATVLEEDVDQRPDFHLPEYVQEGNFGLLQESDQIILKCLFDPEVAKHLRESPLNDTQAMNQHESLRVQLTATIKETAQLQKALIIV